MRRTIPLLCWTLISAGLFEPAFAGHEHPGTAKQLKVSFASAYEDCTMEDLSRRFWPLVGTLPACVPVLSSESHPTNVVTFGPTGAMQAVVTAVPGDIKIAVKAKDIRDGVGETFTGQLTLVGSLRMTSHTCTAPAFTDPCTVVTFAPLYAAVTCTTGRCKAKTTLDTLWEGALAIGDETNLEVLDLRVHDPDADVAFRQGLFVP